MESYQVLVPVRYALLLLLLCSLLFCRCSNDARRARHVETSDEGPLITFTAKPSPEMLTDVRESSGRQSRARHAVHSKHLVR